ncbi:hypothetical protein [Variovorax sp. KBW07]|uniref:hypothetical protein n=1 Tax=Variovorax sp. KBW07 TaxID=2153358 RepID=UPI000F55D4F6|nr:hypothetical protein [Variovorax sp. KBW07]
MKNDAAGRDLFIGCTKNLKILNGENRCNQYHCFLLSALELLVMEKSFTTEAGEWLDIVRSCQSRKISLEDVRKIQEEIKLYKIKLQSLEYPFEENSSKEFVISELFQFAIEHPDDEHGIDARGTGISNGTALAQAIDEFSLLFIEHFGKGGDLVRLLKENFE